MAGGYELGIIESITMVIVVGLSVDYSVHLVHVYQDSENDDVFDREGRVKMSLERMGISVVSGVFTTFGAAMFLWFTDSVFFKVFGTMLAMVVGVSICQALTFLMPLLLIFGPESRGLIPPCFAKNLDHSKMKANNELRREASGF